MSFPHPFLQVFSTIIFTVEKTLDLFINLEIFEGELVLILLVFLFQKMFLILKCGKKFLPTFGAKEKLKN